MSSSTDQIEIVKKTKIAMVALSTRTILLNVFQIVSRIVLAKNLLAADFGAFGILQGILGSLMFFTDMGLGDILSRRSEGISKEDFSSYFFIRLLLSIFIALTFLLIYPLLKNHYGFEFVFAQYAGVIAVFIILDVLAACPMMLMGHRMEFVKIAKIELSGAVITYIVQIAFSFYVKGPWSFFIGLFFGKLTSVFMSFHLAGSIPAPAFNFKLLSQNIAKGFYFQFATILPSLQVVINPFIMSYFLNVKSIGIIFWIEGLVSIPLSLIFNYNRVAFISLSKFTNDVEQLKVVISSFLSPMFFGICFIFGFGAIVSKPLIFFIFGAKWTEATYYIHLSCISIGLYSLRYLGLSVLSAINSPLIRVMNESVLLALSATLIFLAIPQFGIKGYFLASITANLIGLVLMIYSLRNLIEKPVYKRLFSSLTGMMVSILIVFKTTSIADSRFLPGLFFVFLYLIISIVIDSSVITDLKKYSSKLKPF